MNNVHRELLMNRRLIATALMTGAMLPLLASAVLLVGCCRLPLHGIAHELMPGCGMRQELDLSEGDEQERQRPTSVPARSAGTLVPQLHATLTSLHPAAISAAARIHVPSPRSETEYRSYVSLGALRCDQDVGLHLLVATFLI